MKASTCLFLATVLVAGSVLDSRAADSAGGASYYKVQPVFIPYPEPGKSWSIRQYGPVGMSIELVPPAFTIRIGNIEKGSPAEATGKLKKGQIIESINGETLKDIDPRVQLADILGKVEASDGLMKLKIKDEGEVVVTLPVLGAYSKTWPLNCPKSTKIVRNMGDKFAKLEKPQWSAGPFLLSTGEEKDLQTYRRWLDMEIPSHDYPWYIGLWGTSVCEYYLRTGDARVMPAINKMSAKLKASMYNGGWMGRGSEQPNFGYMAGGHMNAAGVHALNFIMLAKECGAEVDDYLLKRVLFQFFRFAGRGNVAYGDQMPEGGFRDNGKTAGLAIAMSSAASLSTDGENSIYAAVRDNSAMKSFYATTWFNRAHTGGGIGEIWHGVAMQLMVDKKPLQYRTFMDERKWFYELSRKNDGTFSISDNGGGYDKPDWGNYFALAYTASRKKLRMFGAPRTEWCKTYALPKRPWGTAADDVFYSMQPGEYAPGKSLDVSKEVIATDASGPLMSSLGTNASDEAILKYANHPDYGIRSAISGRIASGRNHLIIPLLKSKDPRAREAGVLTLAGMFKGKPIPAESITDEMYSIIAAMINDPEESRWTVISAMEALARLPADKIVPLVDRLTGLLKEDDWWTQSAALKPLVKVACDERVYAKVLPAIGEMASKNTAACGLGAIGDLVKQLPVVKPEVQKASFDVFIKTYNAIPDPLRAPGGANLASGSDRFRRAVKGLVGSTPEGMKTLQTMPKMTSRWQASRKDSDKFTYDGTFKPNQALIGKWTTVAKAGSEDALKQAQAKEAAAKAKEAAARAKAAAAPQKAVKPVAKKAPPKKPSYGISSLDLQEGGKVTPLKGHAWSGNLLFALTGDEALEMSIRTVDGKEYLFVEAGGFSGESEDDAADKDAAAGDDAVAEAEDNSKDDVTEWKPQYYVMERHVTAPPKQKAKKK